MIAQGAGQLQTEKSQKKWENEVMREEKALNDLFSITSSHQVITTSQYVKLKKGQDYWTFQKIYQDHLKQVLLRL